DTAADLLNDLGDRTRDDFGRQLGLCGVDPEMEESFLEAANLPVAQEEFVSGKGPIRILVFVQDDMPYQYIFVPHEPIEPVTKLLQIWSLSANAGGETYHKKCELPLDPIFALLHSGNS